ncbi:MAG: DUF2244 domain-containing protein [Betaproteobacteria bacterium]|nr:DUF2244 domain-containing protein [Betaproteobacteria bacterium]MCC6250486.1 DUF2244 domain-containing protein [Rubrivivax sp.]
MTATYVPSSWPAPWPAPRLAGDADRTGAREGAPLRFGREVALTHARGATRALQWHLRRNSSITPRQMLSAYALLCTLSLAVALGFWIGGARVVLAFTGFELMLIGAAMALFARHAGDRETLTLVGRSLLVERSVAERVERAAFSADWLTVEPAAGQNSLVELSGQGHTMRVGRFLRPELRGDFARELRRAMRRAPDFHNDIASGRRAGGGTRRHATDEHEEH